MLCHVICCYSFIHSDHFYSASSSPLVLRSAPDTARTLCRSFTPKRHRQLRVKDLPEIPIRGSESGSRTHGPSVESYRLNQCATTSQKFGFSNKLANPFLLNFLLYDHRAQIG